MVCLATRPKAEVPEAPHLQIVREYRQLQLVAVSVAVKVRL